MNRYVAIAKAAEALGVSITTLRRWEVEGKLIPVRTVGRQRRYDLAKLKPELFHAAPQDRKTIAYARASSHDQKDDLERQKQVLERYCAKQGWTFKVIADLGSGMNYHKKGLKRLLDEIIEGRVGRLVVAHKDCLLRFGAELVFAICEAKEVEVLIINQGVDTTFEEDLAQCCSVNPFVVSLSNHERRYGCHSASQSKRNMDKPNRIETWPAMCWKSSPCSAPVGTAAVAARTRSCPMA